MPDIAGPSLAVQGILVMIYIVRSRKIRSMVFIGDGVNI
jgi:hypothetical protein